MLAFIFAILSLGLLVACVPAGGSTGKTITGKPTTHSPWKTIDETESLVSFAGENKPVIRSIEKRSRDNAVTEERMRLDTEAYPYWSAIFLEYLPSYSYYSIDTTQHIHSKTTLSEETRERFPQATLIEVKAGENREGKYLYAVVELGDGIRCILARQGRGSEMFRGDEVYTAVVLFRYCARKTEREILEIFGNMRLRV